MKQISAAMFLTAALSLGVSAFAQTTPPTNPTGQVDAPTGQAAPQKPADLKDVPAGHWAQEAIKIAADCGIIRGYPDGTFRGNQPITRYEAAAIVARLIAMIKSGACGVGTPGTGGTSITVEQYNDLMNAVQELQADLAQLGVRVAELEDNAVTQDDLARVEELATQARDIAEQAASTADDAAAAAADAADAAQAAQDAADAAQAAADAAQETADANVEAIQAAQDAADAAQEAADNAQATADSIEIPTSDGGTINVGDLVTQSDLENLATQDDVQGLQDQIDALQEAIDNLPEATDTTELQGQVDDLTGTVDDLQAQIDDLNAQIADLGAGTTEPAAEFDPSDLQDQIDDLQAQIADTQDQISALTDAVNAQQETVDGLVDTTAGLQDDVGTLQDTVADLQDQIDALGGDTQGAQDLMDAIDAASIAADTALAQSRELQDKVDELDGRVTDLESGLGELGATVESQADSIAALNDLVVLLNQDVLSLQDRVTQLERQVEDLSGAAPVDGAPDLTDDVTALQDDLDSLREFTTLLRRDQTALADTVGDLEARVGALETKVDAGLAALDKRVSGLEANAFTISGTLSLTYKVARTWFDNGTGAAPDFDVDRLGLNVGFSSGAPDGYSPRDLADFGGSQIPLDKGNRAMAADPVGPNGRPAGNIEGRVDPQFNVTFGLKPRNLVTDPSGFPAGQITLTLSNDGTGFGFNNNNASGITSSIKFGGLAAAFNVGGAPITVNFGSKLGFKFSNYGVNTGGWGDGFVASIDGSSILPFNPTLTLIYASRANEVTAGAPVTVYSAGTATTGTYAPPGGISALTVTNGRTFARIDYTNKVRGKITVSFSDGSTRTFDNVDQTTDADSHSWLIPYPTSNNTGAYNANNQAFVTTITFDPTTSPNGLNAGNGDNNYAEGFSGTLSIIPGLTGGVYFAHQGQDATGGFGGQTNFYGLTFKSDSLFGFLKLDGEYAVYAPVGGAGQVATYVTGGVNFGVISLNANYRFVGGDFATFDSDGAFPYARNMQGFGVKASITKLFGFLDAKVYYDSRTKLLASKGLGDGPLDDDFTNGVTWGNPATATGATIFGVKIGVRLIGFDIGGKLESITENGNSWSASIYEVSARHDGSKSDALIPNLNLAVGYSGWNHSGKIGASNAAITDVSSGLYVYGSYALSFGEFKITPAVYFASTSGDDTGGGSAIGGILTVSTPFLFNSQLSLYGALDSTKNDTTGTPFNSGTTLLRAKLSWTSFLLPNSTFSVAFATRTDTNRNGRSFGPTFTAPEGLRYDGAQRWGSDGTGFGTRTLTGLYLTWSYFDLQFNYGIFNLALPSPALVQWGQEFGISYKLKF
jgi:predicted  nucleic acid-binding Zn-ribbon protein